jgi:hypothetical protein
VSQTARRIAMVGLIVAAVGLSGQRAQAERIPQDVRRAEQTLTRWLNGFDGQTLGQVRQSLGAPSVESSWLYKEKREPLLKYRLSESTELSLYFVKGRVVKPSLHLLP